MPFPDAVKLASLTEAEAAARLAEARAAAPLAKTAVDFSQYVKDVWGNDQARGALIGSAVGAAGMGGLDLLKGRRGRRAAGSALIGAGLGATAGAAFPTMRSLAEGLGQGTATAEELAARGDRSLSGQAVKAIKDVADAASDQFKRVGDSVSNIGPQIADGLAAGASRIASGVGEGASAALGKAKEVVDANRPAALASGAALTAIVGQIRRYGTNIRTLADLDRFIATANPNVVPQSVIDSARELRDAAIRYGRDKRLGFRQVGAQGRMARRLLNDENAFDRLTRLTSKPGWRNPEELAGLTPSSQLPPRVADMRRQAGAEFKNMRNQEAAAARAGLAANRSLTGRMARKVPGLAGTALMGLSLAPPAIESVGNAINWLFGPKD